MCIQLEHEIGREPFEIALYRLHEHFSGYTVEPGQFCIKLHPL